MRTGSSGCEKIGAGQCKEINAEEVDLLENHRFEEITNETAFHPRDFLVSKKINYIYNMSQGTG